MSYLRAFVGLPVSVPLTTGFAIIGFVVNQLYRPYFEKQL